MSDDKIRVNEGTQRVQIPFKLPEKLFETYSGKNVNIFYSIQANADIPLAVDLSAEKTFRVRQKSNPRILGKPFFYTRRK